MGSLKDLPCVYKVKGNAGSQMPYSHFIHFWGGGGNQVHFIFNRFEKGLDFQSWVAIVFHFSGGAAREREEKPQRHQPQARNLVTYLFYLAFIYMKHLQYKNVNFDSS